MRLSPGARIGPYEVVAPLGAGGMGEVYRALDPRLGREVALKVLPGGASADPDKLRRFELEARAAGALNHPNVLGILDIGAHDGHPYVVSELLEGETFRERLRIAPLPVKKALELAVQIAHGLAAAHEKGIVHRDLKPENLFLTRDGRVKILDFGLAKLLRAPAAGEDTPTVARDSPSTEEGTVLGTVGYMSPEQVRGLPADQRSDIFSFGAVLYEMASGQRAFRRDTAAETMTAILKEDPPELAGTVPGATPGLDRILRRCLEKSPDERFHSARDMAYAIDSLSVASPAAGEREIAPTIVERSRTWPGRLRPVLAVGAAAALAALAFLAWRGGNGPAGPDLSAYRFTPVATEAAYEGSPAWSPDGSTLAYLRDVAGVLQVFTRDVAGSAAAQVTDAPRDCRQPFWSPDGTRLYYVSQAGGEDSLWAVSAAGGTPQVVQKNARTAALSPDGRTLALLREDAGQGTFFQSLWMASPPESPPRRYAGPPLAERHAATGTLRFSPDGSRLAVWLVLNAWDARGGTAVTTEFWIVPLPAGAPRVVSELGGVRQHYPYPFSWLDERRIVFGTDRLVPTPGMHLWTADVEDGRVTPITATSGSETEPSVSPDGARIAFTSQDEDYDLVEIQVEGGPGHRNVRTASRLETDPAWSPVGSQYAFVTERASGPEIWLRSSDGAFERPLVTTKSFKDGRGVAILASLAFSPDGQRLAYQRATSIEGNYSLWISTVAGGLPVEIPTVHATYVDFPVWSPDGKWIAFVTMSQGRWALARVRTGGGERPVVVKEGIVYPSSPRWSPRGDWITCDTPDGFALVSPDGASTRVLAEQNWLAHGFSRDGATIFAVSQSEDTPHLQLSSIDVATGAQKIVIPDLGPTPPTNAPLRGFSLAPDGRSFLTSMVRIRGDVWVLDGFARRAPALLERLGLRKGPTR